MIPGLPTHDDGATAFGSHYHKLWHTCRYKHFLEQAAPLADETGAVVSRGIKPKDTPSPLLIGDFLHVGVETLRHEIVRSGDWDAEKAIAIMEARAASRRHEGSTHVDDDLAKAKALFIAYVDWYGPRGEHPEGDEVEVACDDKGPIIEREYRTALPTYDASGTQHVWTCRVDMLAKWQGWTVVWEVKTASGRGGWIWRLFERAHWDLQMTGEVYTLRRNFADRDLAGVLVDALVKDRGAKSSKLDPCYRELVTRSDAQLAAFEQDVCATLLEQERTYSDYAEQVEKGLDPWRVAERLFPRTGMANGLCYAYNRECPFLKLCLEPDRAEKMARLHYRPRTLEEAAFRVRSEDIIE